MASDRRSVAAEVFRHASPIAIAHRGGDEVAPENTVAAFEHAWSLGFRVLETDVHVTADGVLIAFHDADLERLTGRPGALADRTWDELRSIDLGGGHRIPTMAELFETFPTAVFNIDPKADGSVGRLAASIHEHGAVGRVNIGSFSDARISRMIELLGPTLSTSAGPRDTARLLLAARGLGRGPERHTCVQVPLNMKGVKLNPRLVRGLQRRGRQVHVWTVNDAPTMRMLVEWGVDGIMTDRPSLLRSTLEELEVWR